VGSTRVFASFDLEHDQDLSDRLAAQSQRGGSEFQVVACSQPGEMNERWSASARRQIEQADEVILICGEHTASSARMSAELDIAREAKKPYFLLWGRRERMCTKPVGAKPDEGIYGWTPETLREKVRMTLRNAKPTEIPERYKRP
jgi:hypothetical protein